jgi:hypothetical protein
MFSNRLVFALLGIACIVAAGTGGYIATRQNAVPTPAAAMTTTPPAATPDRPVQETEAVVGDTSKAPAPVKRDSARPAAQPAKAAATAKHQAAPALTQTWPSGAAAQAPAPPLPAAQPPAPEPVAPPPPAPEPVRAPEPPQKTFVELVVASNSVIGLQTENRISSETAKVEDRIEARVTRDVKVGDQVAVPAGSRVIGSVVQVERGGKFKERAHLGIRFNTLVLADGTRISINTEMISRDGEAVGNGSAAKVGGGAVGGAILGAILGGAKGAAIGAAAGAGGGAAVVEAGDRSTATLPAGTPMTVRITSPITVTIEK